MATMVTVFDPRNPVESLLNAIAWHVDLHQAWPARITAPAQVNLGKLTAVPAGKKTRPCVTIVRSSSGRNIPLEVDPRALGVTCHPKDSKVGG